MSTLKNVAARCGVDISTASRALRSDPRVKKETRLKVIKAAEELQYSPNLAARNLVKGQSRTLTLITSSLSNPLEQMPAQYASSYLQDRSYDLMISLSGGSEKTYERLLSRLEEKGFPLVFLDRWDNRLSFPVVTTDNLNTGVNLTEKILDKGCQEIILLSKCENGIEEDRIAGEKQACLKSGIPCRVINLDNPFISFSFKNKTGVIASSAGSLYHFAKDYQWEIKDKALFFGVFDQWVGSPYPAQEIIICRQDFQTMAHKACGLILNKLAHMDEDGIKYLVNPLEFVTLTHQ